MDVDIKYGHFFIGHKWWNFVGIFIKKNFWQSIKIYLKKTVWNQEYEKMKQSSLFSANKRLIMH